MAQSICIVGCTAHKRPRVAAAENLYSSDLFIKSRRYAQANFDSWVVLSAKHGILERGIEVEPYDQELDALPVLERRQLAVRVKAQIETLNRLRTHLGTASGGNHRSSVFRLHVGKALIRSGRFTDVPEWGATASANSLDAEQELGASTQ
jgi:hypothetical protein